jgi:hypothetical protein
VVNRDPGSRRGGFSAAPGECCTGTWRA